MPTLVVIVPGSLESRTGGYEYDRRIIAGLRERGWSVHIRELDDGLPRPTTAALDRAANVLAEIPDDTTVLIDGLAFGAIPAQIERERLRLRIVALVHQPLAAEIGLEADIAARLEADERRALAAAMLVITTGKSTVQTLTAYGVDRDRIEVVEPGTARAPLARGFRGSTVQLLSVATLNPGKGHETLIRALAAVSHRDWHLTCAGSLDRHPATVQRVRARLREYGIEDRVSLAGELDSAALDACYDNADVFVLATLRETYGMAVAEALARGVPVVSTVTGAIPELVGADAGLLVPVGDVQALGDALSRVLTDARLRERLADGARRVRHCLRTWEQAVGTMAAALDRVASDG